MKGTPKKETVNLDVSAAMSSANKFTEMNRPEKPERPENEETRLVSLRLKETDYKKLKGLYGGAGLSMSAGLKMCGFYIADMIEQGAFVLSAGGIIDRRK